MFAFVHIEKAAGITVNWILRRSFGLRHCDVLPWRKKCDFFSANDYRRLRKLYSKIDSISGHRVKPYSDLDEVRPDIAYYTIFREPISRCASHYQYMIQEMGKQISFEEWIELERFRNFQTKKIAGGNDLSEAIRTLREKFFFVGLADRFDESMLIFQKRAADKRLNILYRSRNVARNNSIKDQLLKDPRTRAQLVEANRLDVELYSFVTSELYPKQRQEYGTNLESDLAAFKTARLDSDLNIKLIMSFIKRRLLYNPIIYSCQRFHA